MGFHAVFAYTWSMKTILITGATSGFGSAAAKMLAKDNKLILVARRADRLEEMQKSLPASAVHVASVDITDKQAVVEFFKNLPADFKDVDVLINNAGMARGMEPAQQNNLDDWELMVDTNIKGLLRFTRPVLDIMTKRGTGLIINVGSIASSLPYKGGNVYGGTKAFVRQFSRNLRVDLFGKGIKVTTIEPGAAETEFAITRFGDEQKAKEYYQGWRPLTAEDVANAIVWVVNQPPHINIDNIEIMPLDQASAGAALNKKELS